MATTGSVPFILTKKKELSAVNTTTLLQMYYLLPTPDRSVPSSPTLSPAVVTHTNATTRHLHTNDSTAVDSVELTKLLQNVVSNNKKKLQPTTNNSPPLTTTSSSSNSSTTTSLSCVIKRNNNIPSQFLFKKPLYNQHYKQTHFHHTQCTPLNTTLQIPNITNKDSYLAWSELRRFFIQQSPNEEDEHLFANQFNHNISGKYGHWGNYHYEAFSP